MIGRLPAFVVAIVSWMVGCAGSPTATSPPDVAAGPFKGKQPPEKWLEKLHGAERIRYLAETLHGAEPVR